MAPPSKSPTQLLCQRPTMALISGSSVGSSGGGRMASTVSEWVKNSTDSISALANRGLRSVAWISAISSGVLTSPMLSSSGRTVVGGRGLDPGDTHREVGVFDLQDPPGRFLRRSSHLDSTTAHDVDAIGVVQSLAGVLLDYQHGHAPIGSRASDCLQETVDDQRRKAERKLVGQQQARLARE